MGRRTADEHEATLLRIRLQIEAKARAERERLDREHQRALRRLHLETRQARTVRALAVLLVLGTAAGVGGYVGVVTPALRAAHQREVDAQRLAAARAEENVQLMRRLLDAQASSPPALAPPPAAAAPAVAQPPQPNDVHAKPSPRGTPRKPLPRPKPSTGQRHERDRGLDDLDTESDDPLRGLLDANARKR